MKAVECFFRIIAAACWLSLALIALPFAGMDILADLFTTEVETWGR